MNDHKKYIRYIHCDVAVAVGKRVGVGHDNWMQDWPYEVADPKRVSEFIREYESSEWSEVERFALMQLLLFSLDQLGNTEQIAGTESWRRVSRLLVNDPETHIWSFVDIGHIDDRDCGSDYPIAALLQRLYDDHLSDKYPLDQMCD